ncbi:N-acetylglucosamine-6-phosphate deacetylase [Candidatus Hydrogenedentota bacterium]
MARTLRIKNARLVMGDKIVEDKDVWISGGRIAFIGGGIPEHAAFETLDADDMYVAPGFVDIHTHGSFGVDIATASNDELRKMASQLPKHGVTGFCPTLATMAERQLDVATDRIRKALKGPKSARNLGIHLEGPYLNPERPGALKQEIFSKYDREGGKPFSECGVVLVTLAPEVQGAMQLITDLTGDGVTAAVGHSAATWDELNMAVSKGLSHVTHLFNACSPFHHREPGVVGAGLLRNELSVELIADGHHLHPRAIELVARMKPQDKIVLVSDAMAAAGLKDGDYELGATKVHVVDGAARTGDGNLAGSTLTLDKALRNFIEMTGFDLPSAVRTLTANPANVIGLGARKGRIERGYDADLVFVDLSLRVRQTMIGGEIVWKSTE